MTWEGPIKVKILYFLWKKLIVVQIDVNNELTDNELLMLLEDPDVMPVLQKLENQIQVINSLYMFYTFYISD